LNGNGGKPKAMHWRTFQRLKAEYHAYANASWAGIAERLGLVNRRLDGILDDVNTERQKLLRETGDEKGQ